MALVIVVVVLGMIALAVFSDLRDRRVRGRVRGAGDITSQLRERRREARARRTIGYRRTGED